MIFSQWYDQDPTVSMAVSLLQNADKAFQNQVADYVFARVQLNTQNTDLPEGLGPLTDPEQALLTLLKQTDETERRESALLIIQTLYDLECHDSGVFAFSHERGAEPEILAV